MFRRLAQSVKTFARGPRAVLSSLITSSLSEYFILDDDLEELESTLLSSDDNNAHIKMQHMKLREKKFLSEINENVVITVKGIVGEAEFSWKWGFGGSSSGSDDGGSNSSSFVQNAMLSMKRLQVHIYFESLSDLKDEEKKDLLAEAVFKAKAEDDESNASNASAEKEGFLQHYIQEIVDHLTLSVGSFEFHIHVKDYPSITLFAGKDVELRTLKSGDSSKTSTLLSQFLSIGSFSIYLIEEDKSEIPLLESFSYDVSIIRFAGTRFKGGILSGLEIIGLEKEGANTNRNSITFHVGEKQIQAFCAIGNLYATKHHFEESTASTCGKDDNDTCITSTYQTESNDTSEEGSLFTVFRLPLPPISLLISSNNVYCSSISLPSFTTLLYRTDGKIFTISGSKGIELNKGKSFLKVEKWSCDLVRNTFTLGEQKPNATDHEKVNVIAFDDEISKIWKKLIYLMSATDVTNLQRKWYQGKDTVVDIEKEKCIDIEQKKRFKITSENKTLIYMVTEGKCELQNYEISLNLGSFQVSISQNGSIESANLQQIKFATSLDTHANLSIPSLQYDGHEMTSKSIMGSIASIEKATLIQDFVNRFSSQYQSSAAINDANYDRGLPVKLPFIIKIPQISVSLEEFQATLSLEEVTYDNCSLKFGKVYVNTGIGLEVMLHSVCFRPEVLSINESVGARFWIVSGSKNSVKAVLSESNEKVDLLVRQFQVFISSNGDVRSADLQQIKFATSLDTQANLFMSFLTFNKDKLVTGVIEGSIGSEKSVQAFQDFLACFSSQLQPYAYSDSRSNDNADYSFNIPVVVNIPRVSLSIKEYQATLSLEKVILEKYKMIFGLAKAYTDEGVKAMFEDIRVSLEEGVKAVKVIVCSVPLFTITGVLELSSPLTNFTIFYKNGIIDCDISQVPIHILLSNNSKLNKNKNDTPNNHSNFELPFSMNIIAREMYLKKITTNEKHLNSSIKTLSLTVNPGMSDLLDIQSDKFIQVGLFLGALHNDLFQIDNIKSSFKVNPLNSQALENLAISLGTAKVTAGYSSLEWSRFFESEKNSTPQIIQTPFVKIDEFKVYIQVRGKLLSSGNELFIKSFEGNSITTSEDLKKYYCGLMIDRFPSFLSNTEFLGTNIVEGTFSGMGVSHVGKGVVGGGVGSLVGVAALDGVKSAVASGKKERNANVNDGYKFGDFTRGLIRGGREASKKGSQLRGDNEYIPGDMTAGTVAGMVEYTSNNKSKLAKSAGSGSAAMVGLAVAGPLGFIAGSYLGGKAVGSIVKDDAQGDELKLNQQNPVIQGNTKLASDVSSTSPKHAAHYADKGAPLNSSQYSLLHQSGGNVEYNKSSQVQPQYNHNQSQLYAQNQNRYEYGKNASKATQLSSSQYSSLYQSGGNMEYNKSSQVQPQQQNETESYKFGDFTKSIIAKGKKSDGRNEKDGYRFGDFTRGLFSG